MEATRGIILDQSEGNYQKKRKRIDEERTKGEDSKRYETSLSYVGRLRTGNRASSGQSMCRNTHDIAAYLAAKPKDIHFDPKGSFTNDPPFVEADVDDTVMTDAACPSLDRSTTCPVHASRGECKYGLKCRFLGAHVRQSDDGTWELITDPEKIERTAVSETELNFADAEVLKKLRTKKV